MKMTEFRIGNLCRDKVTGNLLKVTELNEENAGVGFMVLDRHQYPLPEGWLAEPIPLTPEILEKCGFENLEAVHRLWLTEGFGIDIEGSAFMFIMRYRMNGGTKKADKQGPYIELLTPPANLEHVHQLQNLYYSLTGEELIINL